MKYKTHYNFKSPMVVENFKHIIKIQSLFKIYKDLKTRFMYRKNEIIIFYYKVEEAGYSYQETKVKQRAVQIKSYSSVLACGTHSRSSNGLDSPTSVSAIVSTQSLSCRLKLAPPHLLLSWIVILHSFHLLYAGLSTAIEAAVSPVMS